MEVNIPYFKACGNIPEKFQKNLDLSDKVQNKVFKMFVSLMKFGGETGFSDGR